MFGHIAEKLFKFLCVHFLISTPSGILSRRIRYHRVGAWVTDYGYVLGVTVGNPPQRFQASLDTQTAHMIAMDHRCGATTKPSGTQCPRLCSDPLIQSSECHPLCETISPQSRVFRCVGNRSFISHNSTTFEELGEEFFAKYRLSNRNTHPFYGKWAQDEVQVTDYYRRSVLKRKIKFIRGLRFDVGYTGLAVVNVGLASSRQRNSVIYQLKKAQLLEAPYITVHRRLQDDFPSEALTLGAMDKSACRDWKWEKTANKTGWDFRMGNVRFAGREVKGVNMGRILLNSQHLAIPSSLLKELIADGLITPVGNYKRFYRVRDGDGPKISMSFDFDGQRFEIPSEHLVAEMPLLAEKRKYTTALITDSGDRRFADEPDWGFGIMLMQFYCYGYDYKLEKVGLARRRVNWFMEYGKEE